MERNVRRIDGEITHLHHLSDEELANHYGYAAARMQAAHADMDALQDEMFKRAHPELPFEDLGNYAEIADVLIERTDIAQLGHTAVRGRD